MSEFEQAQIERGIFANTKLALFDVGGVLLRFMGGVEALSAKTNLPYERCREIWLELDDSICRGKTQPQKLWDRIKEESHYSGEDIDFVSFWVKHFEPNLQVHKLIRDVSRNRPVGLLTNIYPGVYAKAVETGNIPDLPYAFVLQSCETGLIKPEKQIYELAEKMGGKKSSDILLIDDSPRFITPAQELGWKTYSFDSNNPSTSVASLRNGFAL